MSTTRKHPEQIDTSGSRRSSNQPDGTTIADALRPLFDALLSGEPPVRFAFWDGSASGPDDAPGVVRVNSPMAVRRVLWSPNQLGLGRAYVSGEIDIDGDIFAVVTALRDAVPPGAHFGREAVMATFTAAKRLGVVGPPPPPPREELRPRGLPHSKRRDARAVQHHYDVGNHFYRLVLGPAMAYSCALFSEPGMTLEQAQVSKHDLICRKLGLHERPGMRVLDVGCGWGSLAIHAATTYGARVVGITISPSQAELARQRVSDAGVARQVDIRLQDYRDLEGETFDVIASVGMFEHVGARRMGEYFRRLYSLLPPTGRLLNHAISSVGGSRLGSRSFVGRYVFPDGELIDVSVAQQAMERVGFEIRDIESLREHYATTLRRWVANLEANWDRAVALAGEARARVWRLYMTGSAIGFEDAGISVHQVLAVKTDASGFSAMPPTRRDWL